MFVLDSTNRRGFLRQSLGGAAAIGVGSMLPGYLAEAATADGQSNELVLVVVQLSGGNDGLNTVVPYSDDAYYAARPDLAIGRNDVLRVDDQCGLHPSLVGLDGLLQDGKLTVVQGVGYANPNRSHFESMDIWHTCRRKDESRPDGWLGRFLESQPERQGGDVPALHLGDQAQPFAVASTRIRVPTVKELSEFQLRGGDRDSLRSLLRGRANVEPSTSTDSGANELLQFLESSTASAMIASERVSEAAKEYRTEIEYPGTPLAQKLRVVAQLIDAGLTTRVYYVQLDGFDTHAQQAAAHTVLLRQWSDAVSALVRDLDDHGHGQRVCVMTFSEFGRRVEENASGGTDHGAAGPMFLCGGGLRAGLVGPTPDLTDLQQGDLRYSIDFRQVYASVLKNWLGAEPEPILGSRYETLPLFNATAIG